MSRTGGGKEVLSTAAVVVGVGVGVAAFAGLGLAGAAFGAGVLSASAFDSFTARRAKPPLQHEGVKRDEQGYIENWPKVLKAVQDGVRPAAAHPHLVLPLSRAAAVGQLLQRSSWANTGSCWQTTKCCWPTHACRVLPLSCEPSCGRCCWASSPIPAPSRSEAESWSSCAGSCDAARSVAAVFCYCHDRVLYNTQTSCS